jgi:hypothetical protein
LSKPSNIFSASVLLILFSKLQERETVTWLYFPRWETTENRMREHGSCREGEGAGLRSNRRDLVFLWSRWSVEKRMKVWGKGREILGNCEASDKICDQKEVGGL